MGLHLKALGLHLKAVGLHLKDVAARARSAPRRELWRLLSSNGARPTGHPREQL
jgi:hypothetical protein